MRKPVVLFLAFWVIGFWASSQAVTLRWAVGYGGAVFGKNENIPTLNLDFKTPQIDAFVPLATSDEAKNTYKLIKKNYGQGFNATLGLGYAINKYIGVEVAATYAESGSITANQVHGLYLPDSTGVLQSTGVYMDDLITVKTRDVYVKPSVYLMYTKDKWKLAPYLRLGLIIPVYTQIIQTINISMANEASVPNANPAPYFLGTHTNITIATRQAFTMGFNASVGCAYKPASFINIFLELTTQYLYPKAVSATITQWDADGVDMLAARGNYRNQFNYVNKLSSTSNNAEYNNGQYNPDVAKDVVKPKLPFASIGFNAGIQLMLNKQIFSDRVFTTQKKAK